MNIKLSPAGDGGTISVVKLGEALTINGQLMDFTQLPDGATLPSQSIDCAWIGSAVERVGGDLVVTVRLPHDADASESVRFPGDIENPPDGPVLLPTGFGEQATDTVPVAIDWSQMITAEQKAQAAAEQLLAQVVAETARYRAMADAAIAPLQDAVDLDEATAAEVLLLKDWKRYRIALNRLPEQAGYPVTIDWPAQPA